MAFWHRRTAPKAHWSKDYIEHLRTIHFALIAVSIAAIVISGAPNTYRIRAAQRQLRTIQDFLEKRVENWRRGAAPNDMRLLVRFRKQAHVIPVPQTFVVIESQCEGQRKKRRPLEELGTELENVRNLEQFEDLWNQLKCSNTRFYQPVALANSVLKLRERVGPQKVVWSLAPKSLKVRQLQTSLDFIRPSFLEHMVDPRKLKFVPTTFAFKPVQSGDELALFMVISDETAFSVIVKLNSGLPTAPLAEWFKTAEPRWGCTESFAQCFPDLDWFRKDKKDFRLQDMSDAIEDNLSGFQARDFEALGIKFPVEHQAAWGIITLLSIQLYLCLHLLELSPFLAANDERPLDRFVSFSARARCNMGQHPHLAAAFSDSSLSEWYALRITPLVVCTQSPSRLLLVGSSARIHLLGMLWRFMCCSHASGNQSHGSKRSADNQSGSAVRD